MASINRWYGIGNLTRDPELRDAGGSSVCNFSIACNEKWKDKQGQMQEKVEFIRIVAWGKVGELCNQYLSKGSLVYIEGKLQTTDWTDKDDNKRQTVEVNAREVQFLDKKGKQPEPREQRTDGGAFRPPTPDEDVPF